MSQNKELSQEQEERQASGVQTYTSTQAHHPDYFLDSNRGTPRASIVRVNNNSNGYPSSEGMLISYKIGGSAPSGYQLFVARDNKVYSRIKTTSSGSGNWVELYNASTSRPDQFPHLNSAIRSNNAFNHPTEYISDANTKKVNGYWKTNYNCNNLPSGIGRDTKSGIIQVVVEETNGTSNKGYQLYIPLNDRNFMGIPFMRVFGTHVGSSSNGYFSEWVNPVTLIRDKALYKPEHTDLKSSGSDLDMQTTSGIFRVDNNATNKPEHTTKGILQVLKYDDTFTSQMFTSLEGSTKGKIYSRSRETSWTTWTQIGSGGTVDLSNYYNKSESDGKYTLKTDTLKYIQRPETDRSILKISDLNKVGKKSGVFRTESASNAPISGVYGVVEVLLENENGSNHNGTGVMRWTCINGPHKGKTWSRAFEGDTRSEWKEITQSLPNNIYQHPSTLQGSLKNAENGFYFTSEANTGFPKELTQTEDKKGLLQVFINGQNKMRTYSPLAGKHKHEMYILNNDENARTDTNLDWNKVGWASNGYSRIWDTRDEHQKNPNEYFQHRNEDSGIVVREWKWSSSVDLQQQMQLPDNRDLIVTTTVPSSRQTLGQDIVFQEAFDIQDHRRFFRKANNDQGTLWSTWTEETGGSSAGAWLKPENDSVADNIDNIKTSSTRRVHQGTLGQFPVIVSSGYTQKTGIVQTVMAKGQTHGIQTLALFHDSERKHKVFKRLLISGTWDQWQESGGQVPSGGFDRQTFNTWLSEQLQVIFAEWKQQHN